MEQQGGAAKQQLQHVVAYINSRLAELDKDLNLGQYQYLNLASEKTGLDRAHFVLSGVCVSLLLIIYLFGLSFVSNALAFVPIYDSFKALRQPGGADVPFWLTYWVVYGSLSLFESFIDEVFFWLPFYFLFKIGFLIWAFHPNSRGALVIYDKFLNPIFIGVEREAALLKSDLASISQKRYVD